MHKKINKNNVKFLEFTRIRAKKPNCLICFFEGEDARYYGIRIQENLHGIEWEGIDCGGKQQVIELCQVLETHSEYHCAKTAFFVDRDFDPPLSFEKRTKIYETPCYSVENFYTSLTCFEQILKYGFKIREFVEADIEADIFKKCISLFIQTKQEFHDAIAPLNAWIMLMRNLEKEFATHKKDSLNDIKFEKLVKIEVDNVTKLYTIEYINNLFPKRNDIPEIEVTKKVNSFSTIDCGKTFRGKYEVAFLSKFLTKLKDELCAISPKHFYKKRKIHFSLPISSSDILSQFSQYADTPQCLRDYLKNFSTGKTHIIKLL